MSRQLDTYLARDVIDATQHRAGKLFAADFAQRYPSVRHRSMAPGVRHRGGPESFSMAGIGAARAGQALRHLGELRHVVVAVCWEDRSAGAWARSKGVKESDGLPLLRAGLDVLVTFYELRDDDAA